MKKLLILFFVFSSFFLISCSDSVTGNINQNDNPVEVSRGSWGGWADFTVGDSPVTLYFTPSLAGTHKIECKQDYSYWNKASIYCYWRDGMYGNWNHFATDRLDPQDMQTLYSGSSSIMYKFVLYKISQSEGTINAHCRFYTDY